MAFSAESRADDNTKHDKSTHTTESTSSSTKSSTDSSSSGVTQGSTGTDQSGSVSGSSQPGMSSVPCPTGQQPCDTWGTGAMGTGAPQGNGISGGVDNNTGIQGQLTTPDYQTYPAEQQQMNTTTPPTYSTSTTTTTQAAYDPSLYADRTTTYSSRPNRPLLVTGSAIFLGSYGATALQGVLSDNQADEDNNFIPLAGPWMNLSDRPCGIGDCGTGEDVNQVLLIGSGIAQAAGVAIALSSLFIPEEREVSYSAKAKHVTHTAKADKPSVSVMPMAMGRNASGGGFGAVGRF
jgi:hypothetical protein